MVDTNRAVVGRCYSDWRPVTSSILQGSVIGHFMFLILNDLDTGMSSLVLVGEYCQCRVKGVLILCCNS